MSKGNIQASRSHSGNVGYYLREDECEAYLHAGHPMATKTEVLAHWKGIEHDEVFGNKALGIRGRHDAQVRTNYMLTMPNDLSPHQVIERVRAIVEKTPIRDCVYTICVHGGRQGEVERNQHVHLLVNERSLVTGKKIRELSQKPFLEKLKEIYRKEFALEFSQGKEVASRERIASSLWKASPALARELCAELQKGKEQGIEKKRVGFTAEHATIVGVLRRTIAAHGAEKKEIEHEIQVCRSQLAGLPAEIAQIERNKTVTLDKELRWQRERVEELREKKKDIDNASWIIRTMTPAYRKEVLADLDDAEKKYEQNLAAKSAGFDEQLAGLERLRLSLMKRLEEAEEQELRSKKEGNSIPREIDKAVITVFDHQLTLEEKNKLIYHGYVQIPVKNYIGKSGVPQDGAIRLVIDESKRMLTQKFFTQEEVARMANMQNRTELIARKIQEESQQRISDYQQKQEQQNDQEIERNRGRGMKR